MYPYKELCKLLKLLAHTYTWTNTRRPWLGYILYIISHIFHIRNDIVHIEICTYFNSFPQNPNEGNFLYNFAYLISYFCIYIIYII